MVGSPCTAMNSALRKTAIEAASARFPKFVRHRGNLLYELRKAKGTSKPMILVPLSI
jgi:hypothetical protein